MLKIVRFKTAIHILLILLCLTILFHLLVLIEIIPYTIVWGGRLKTTSAMVRLEIASIAINILLIAVITVKSGYQKLTIPSTIITVILWIYVILFSINTIGNLAAKMTLETVVFTPITLLLALLCYRIIKEPNFLNK